MRLTYEYYNETASDIIWKQSSWITNDTINGANLSLIPDQLRKSEGARFQGLALSSSSSTYLDGSPGYGWAFHSVGCIDCAQGTPSGIPGDYGEAASGVSANSSSLYI